MRRTNYGAPLFYGISVLADRVTSLEPASRWAADLYTDVQSHRHGASREALINSQNQIS